MALVPLGAHPRQGLVRLVHPEKSGPGSPTVQEYVDAVACQDLLEKEEESDEKEGDGRGGGGRRV